MSRSARDPWVGDRPPHLPQLGADVPRVFLLPGDPARVDLAGAAFDQLTVIGQNREFRVARARLDGQDIGLCSTGIGGPSTEIAVAELARLGVRTVIRVGGMGALDPSLAPGSFGVVTAACPESGAAALYRSGDGSAASPEVVAALQAACARVGRPVRRIRVRSCDSYYLAQGRPLAGLEQRAARRMELLVASGVDGLDMETETVLAVGGALGMRVGALLGVHANRATDDWLEDYEPLQVDVVAAAARAALEL